MIDLIIQNDSGTQKVIYKTSMVNSDDGNFTIMEIIDLSVTPDHSMHLPSLNYSKEDFKTLAHTLHMKVLEVDSVGTTIVADYTNES